MKIATPSFFKYIAIAAFAVFISSCEENFNSVGSDIIGDPNFNFDLYDAASVVGYSRRANPVETTNLPVYQLGVYNDPIFGVTQASVLAQVTLDQVNPTFGLNPEIESVILSIPYFSTSTGTGEEITYTLDSIFGSSPIKLSVYESNFFLRDFDPNSGFEDAQKYFSNQGPLFQSFLGELLYENLSFTPSNAQVVINPGEDTEEKLAPRLRVELPIAFFQQKIISQEGSDVLLNNSNFKNHFRGIYFIAESISAQGNLILFDVNQAKIEIKYTKDNENPTGEITDPRLNATLGMSFNGIKVNTFINNFPTDIEQVLNNPNTAGEQNLYIKGGAGAFSVIELFGPDTDGNGVADELDFLRSKKWLINEADLILQVNQDIVQGGNSEPERLFIYDLNNNRVIVDYTLDNLTPASDPLNFKTNHSGRLKRDASGNGTSYKIKLTNHISHLINRDSTNVRLGLLVTQNINILSSQQLQNTTPPGIDKIPAGSVISPEGTVLYGSQAVDPEKRIKLNIYFTEINN
ncbi:MAG: hypothetical protein CVU03_05145 [Bacteroidetes bacterium HGW-Bacteroidetes-2]|jgi:hypothetical protein|nr:MAG: hypothetical protein CVU03_05145 [Bacteroidetes bacterium HGW-Bacteroidetes-2]